MSSDHKRAAETGDADSPKRRKPLDVLSEEGPLTQADVVYFQKEAIWRQMKQYRDRSAQLSRQVEAYIAKAHANEVLVAVLSGWYEELGRLLTSKGVAAATSLSQNLLAVVPEGAEQFALLDARRSELLAVLTPLLGATPRPAEPMELRVEALLQEVATLKAEHQAFSGEKKMLAQTIKHLEADLEQLLYRYNRVTSVTVARASEAHGGEPETTNAPPEAPTTAAPAEAVPVDGSVVELLTVELAEIKALNTSLLQQLGAQQTENASLHQQTGALKAQVANPTEKDLHATPTVQALEARARAAEATSAAALAARDLLATEVQELEGERSRFRGELKAAMEREVAEAKHALAKSEMDLTRVRAARDDLLAQVAVLKGNKVSTEVVQGFTVLLEAQTERAERAERAGQQHPGDGTQPPQGEGAVSLPRTLEQLETLNRNLSLELKELETAFRSVHALSLKKLTAHAETDSLTNKLNVEKSKADQKYFAAMRAKDALAGQNKTLTQQLTATREALGLLKEVEKAHVAKIEAMEAAHKELKGSCVKAMDAAQRKGHEASQSHAKMALLGTRVKELQAASGAETARYADLQREKGLVEREVARLQARVEAMETLLGKYKAHIANSTGAPFDEDQKTVEALRALAKCSVCSKNWKDTAITVCGHVFCHECADDRIKSRMRKCPSCNKQFSLNDLLTIHL